MKRFALLLLPALILTWRGASLAENVINGSVTVGGAVVNADNESSKHGEYSGVSGNKIYATGAADILYSPGQYYLEFKADDVGLENRGIHLVTGEYGKYRVFLGYNELTRRISNNSKTPYNGAGGPVLTLPQGFTRASTTSGMSNLRQNLKSIELELHRKTWSAGFDEGLGRDAGFHAVYIREEKEGVKSLGGALGINGGNTRGIVLPEPVDYDVNEIRAGVSYEKDSTFAAFEYYLSLFDNNHDSIIWDNPFNVAAYPTTARTSLPPDNIFQKFSLSGGTNLPFSTRINALVEYGKMTQDEDLLPYSNNPASTVTQALPRETAEAEIDTYTLILNISSKPFSRLGLNARYRYNETKNKTPRNLFRYVKNDQGAAQAALTEAHALYNLPYDYAQNQFKLDASYYLFRGTSVRAGYDYEVIDRDYREIKRTKENTYRLAVQSQYIPDTSLGLNFSYAQRKAKDPYSESNVYDEYHTTDYINTVASNVRFDNHPQMRKFDIADRTRKSFGASSTFMLSPKATAGLYYNATADEYDDTIFGLKDRDAQHYTIDASYSPDDWVSIYAFLTREYVRTSQASRQYSGNASKASQSADPGRDWTAFHDDNINTVGVGTKFAFLEDALTISADYTYSESKSNLSFAAGAALSAPLNMPDLKTSTHVVDLKGDYRVKNNVSIGAGYRFESYESDDWQTDNFEPGSSTITNVITLSGAVPDYEAHQAMVFLTYHIEK